MRKGDAWAAANKGRAHGWAGVLSMSTGLFLLVACVPVALGPLPALVPLPVAALHRSVNSPPACGAGGSHSATPQSKGKGGAAIRHTRRA